MSSNQRNQNFIDIDVQGALVKRILFHWFGFFLVLGISVIGLKALLSDPGTPFSQRMIGQAREFSFIAIVMFALFPVFVLDTIRFSNRFVGPVTRLRRSLRDLKSGQVETLKFRGHDFWNEMANEYNELTEFIQQQHDHIARLKSQLPPDSVDNSAAEQNELVDC